MSRLGRAMPYAAFDQTVSREENDGERTALPMNP